ncbi:MAG: PatB family C-S lyase [Bacteroidales bacterium]|jgi:cystathionine beta-lyase|nr:PatB family C-S lyase [Bacteroidales bacterium]
MTKYDFDTVIDRRGTGAVKTDRLLPLYGRDDLLPLWVADMDFPCGDFIVEALQKRINHGIFGYTLAQPSYYQSIISWVNRLHGWEIQKEWLSYIPGIVKGIGLTLMCFTCPGDKVIIQSPVYHPFRIIPELQCRTVIDNPLIENQGTYRMDLDGLKKIMKAHDCKILILSSPHNPAGVVWDKETLQKLALLCQEHGVMVISDEIHGEMTLFGRKHIPFATVSPAARDHSITFMAPSKTFNIAGIVTSYAIVPNDTIREHFFHFLHSAELDQGTIFAYTATEAAYKNGENWRQQMLRYVEENILFVDNFLKTHIPNIKVFMPQASFLLWLDCRDLHLNQEKLKALFVEKAGLALNEGSSFGIEGTGFMRMNVGCSRIVLNKALENLKAAMVSGYC